MSPTEKIKNLIADGKTQQAIDTLYAYLQENNQEENELSNQILLLEGQYKEVQKKVQLALEEGSADINRINYSLLNLCDEVEKSITEKTKKMGIVADTEGSKNLSMNPLVIFGVIAAVGILTVLGILFLGKSDVKTSIGQATQATKALPLPAPKAVESKHWHALESVLTVVDPANGRYQIVIADIKSENLDALNDRLILNLKNNCLQATSGKCLTKNLTFNLTIANNKVLVPETQKAFEPQAEKTTREESVSFIVPKSINSGILDIFHSDKPKSKITTKITGD